MKSRKLNETFNKIVSLILLCVVLFEMTWQVCAVESEGSGVVDEYGATIDELYEKRLELCADYEANREQIEEIDSKLRELGVVELSSEEVKEKCLAQLEKRSDGGVMPRYSWIPTESGITWTSRTYIYVDRGQQFEIEEVRGVDAGTVQNPGKLRVDYGASSFLKESQNVRANATIVKGVIATVAGLTPTVTGTIISTGITIYDTVKNLTDITEGTVLNKVETSMFVRMQNDIVMLFVKRYGASDESEVLMYTGNNVLYDVSTYVYMLNSTPIGQPMETEDGHSVGNMYSPYYNNRSYTAVQNYRIYEDSPYNSITTNYHVNKMSFDYIDGDRYDLDVPTSDYVF